MIYILTNKSPLWLKDIPDKSGKNVGVIKPGDVFTVTSETGDWYGIGKGYLYKYNSDDELVANTDITKIANVKKKEDTSEDSLYDVDMFPASTTTWTEGNKKYTIIPGSDGKYTQVVSYEENGVVHNITYVYTREATLSTTHVTGPTDRQTRTVVNEDGTMTVEKYEDIDGVDTKITSTYDKNGNLIGQSKNPVYDTMLSEVLHSANLFGDAQVDGNNLPLTMTTISGILGIPYQFMDIVDRRNVNGRIQDVGRMYADRVVARMPLFIISPGEPEFLAGWSEEERAQTVKALLSGSNSQLKSLANRQGRYYVFKSRFDLYCNYLNNLMRAAASFLGIANKPCPFSGNDNFHSYDWAKNYNKDIHAQLNYHQSIAFYIHADNQISDSFHNETRASQLAEKINGFSDLAKEIQYLTGTTGAMAGIGAMTDLVNQDDLSNVENMTDFTEKVLGSGDFIKAISGNIATIIQGGKLIFPEIWGDSQYSKSYSVTFKFRCPNPDPVSWYLDIWAPVAHLLPLVLPKMSGANGYVAPFIVRAFYKGLFNCQMGIVTNMTINRGDMGSWTLDGLPTAVDVNLEIKDLYNVLGLTGQNNSMSQMLDNIAMLDYVANFCGININVPDWERALTYGMNLVLSTPSDAFSRLSHSLDTWSNNIKQNLVSNLLGSRY